MPSFIRLAGMARVTFINSYQLSCATLIGWAVSLSPANAATFDNFWQTNLAVQTFQDAQTNDNQTTTSGGQRWTIDPGADVFEQELYERPTNAMSGTVSGVPAADKYYQYLDIVSGQFALDVTNQYAYFSIDLFGLSEVNSSGAVDLKGLVDRYRIRVSDNANFGVAPNQLDVPYGYMFGVDNPSGNSVDGTFDSFVVSGDPNCKDTNCKETYAWVDSRDDGAVTGTALTATGEGTQGYDYLTGPKNQYIQSRVLGTSVQLAIAYGALGISESYFSYMIFEAVKGLTDPQNYFWNDEYTLAQAGSPYDPSNPPDGSVYELDTLKGLRRFDSPTEIPVPAALPLFAAALGALGFFGWRKKRNAAPVAH